MKGLCKHLSQVMQPLLESPSQYNRVCELLSRSNLSVCFKQVVGARGKKIWCFSWTILAPATQLPIVRFMFEQRNDYNVGYSITDPGMATGGVHIRNSGTPGDLERAGLAIGLHAQTVGLLYSEAAKWLFSTYAKRELKDCIDLRTGLLAACLAPVPD
jgi:hypothetical protein